jgi:succinate-acetate transporter protein
MAATPDTQSTPAPAPSAGWKVADPGPLGLGAFAMTTFVLSMFNSNLMNPKGVAVVLGLALFYGGAVQLLAGMWEFRTGNTFGAVAFSSFGAFWLSFWALLTFHAADATAHGIALYLWAWAIFTAYMCVASLRTSAAVFVVFLLLTITFILLAIGDMGGVGGHPNVTHAGGYVGLATAIAAWYASFAAVINSTFGRVVLPVRPLAR